MVDQCSTPTPSRDTLPNSTVEKPEIPGKTKAECLICEAVGRVVNQFPRRGYRSSLPLSLKPPKLVENLGLS